MADIMAQHFSPISLIEVSGALYEEGLGESDMPGLATMQGVPGQPAMLPQQPPFSGPPQAQGPVPPPVGAGPTPSPMGGPPGTNVIPFPGAQQPVGPMGMAPPPIPPEFQAKLQGLQRISDAIKLLRNERLRGFRVDIEVDSTISGDSQQEKGDRVQFITVVTQFLQQGMMMSAQVPEIAPLLGKFLQFGVRGFRVGRDLEAAIEDFTDQATKLAQQKQQEAQQKPNPDLISAQADMLKAQSTAQSNKAKDQRENTKLGMEGQKQEADLKQAAMEGQAEVERQHLENQGEAQNAAAEAQQQQVENRAQQQQAAVDMHMKNMEVGMKQIDMKIAEMREMMEMMKMQRMQRENIDKAMAEPSS